jgi:hypothetical protein
VTVQAVALSGPCGLTSHQIGRTFGMKPLDLLLARGRGGGSLTAHPEVVRPLCVADADSVGPNERVCKMEDRSAVSPLRRRDPVGRFSIGWFGLELVLRGGHAGLRGWSRRALALVAGVALALSVGAVTATSASAFASVTGCSITVTNNTDYRIRVYANGVYGDTPVEGPYSIDRWGGTGEWDVKSNFPISNHCSLNLLWEMENPDGTPEGGDWSRALETYAYDPNSGSNNAWASASGDFLARVTLETNVMDLGAWEYLTVTLSPHAPEPCPPKICGRRSAATATVRSSPAALRAGAYPLGRAADAAARLAEPEQVPSLLRRADLIGRGWGRATRLVDLGSLGRILSAASAAKVPVSCWDKAKNSEPSPLKEGLSAFFRRGGAEFIGAGQSIYANARQSRRTINDAVSTRSIGCLARVLTSKRFHTSVSTERLAVTLAGRRMILNRLKVSTHSGARITRTDYVDLIGVQHGKANALMIFASDKHPDTRGVAAAIGAVVGRLP